MLDAVDDNNKADKTFNFCMEYINREGDMMNIIYAKKPHVLCNTRVFIGKCFW